LSSALRSKFLEMKKADSKLQNAGLPVSHQYPKRRKVFGHASLSAWRPAPP
jgi:hypothetical protein